MEDPEKINDPCLLQIVYFRTKRVVNIKYKLNKYLKSVEVCERKLQQNYKLETSCLV